jgi:antitoxin VapB
MALRIMNADVERLARELAKETGESLTVALEERLRRRRSKPGSSLRAELEAIGQRCSQFPVLDPRRPEEIVGYDASGLPH